MPESFNMLNSITDQERPIARLMAMLIKNTAPHAMLFSGIEGIGKNTIATSLAMAFNCRNKTIDKKSLQPASYDFNNVACRKCASCKKILSGNHPDFIQINPSGKIIKISQIRDLCSTLLIKPYEAEKRVVIINKAETMNQEAGNALLKVLEEPPENTVFVVISKQPSDLLPTILSRCQNIGFYPVSSENIAIYLKQNYNSAPDKAEIIASMANGSLKKAIQLAGNDKKQKQWFKNRLWLIDEFNSLRTLSMNSRLLFAEKLVEKKEVVSDLLEILLTYIRDLIVYKFDSGKIINRDLTKKISDISKMFSVKSLLSITDRIQAAQKDIHANASLRLTLELLVIKISRV